MKSLAGPLAKGIAFVAVTVVATAALGITIANTDVGPTNDYYAVFTDVTSLNVGDDVRIAGVRVGQVEQIAVTQRRLARVEFEVSADRELPAAVTATIKYRNLVGQRYIALDQGVGSLGPLAPGATIGLAHTHPALDLTDLFDGFKPLFQALSPSDVNQLSNEIVQVLQGEGGTVDSLIAHTASLTTTLADRDRVIGQVIDNLNSVLDTVNSRGGELSDLVTTLQQLVSGLAADRQPIGDAIKGIGDLTGSTANLLRLGRAPLKHDIAALGQLSANLAGNSGLVATFLRNLPVKYQKIGTIASYGSWLNFYLCAATVSGATEDGTPVTGVPVTESRCRE
ncbi:MAG TPA: MlaD family protein [Pseudonocardiaceae bacterium]|nr:MlaD family protein [Pseudonocardiaceae bacterium]